MLASFKGVNMLYLLLFKFALFLLLCAWLTQRNNLQVKLWSDEQLIKSLPRYLLMKKNASCHYNLDRFLNLDRKIQQIESETCSRFKCDCVKASTLNYGHKAKLIKSLEGKQSQAKNEGNDFAELLIERQIENLLGRC